VSLDVIGTVDGAMPPGDVTQPESKMQNAAVSMVEEIKFTWNSLNMIIERL
jgi:hypothetical protein